MFTGIIEGRGKATRLEKTADFWRVAIRLSGDLSGVKVGDSIAVDGVCLTAVKVEAMTAVFEIVNETLRRTTLGGIKTGDEVNLERAMTLTDRLSGHLVTGHIDGVGTITNKAEKGEVSFFQINLSPELLVYLVPQGSVAVDGISLTVVEISEDSLLVHIIPHTLKATSLGLKGVGDRVNVEVDLLGKYVYKFTRPQRTPKKENIITRRFLAEQGFI